ncbi:MAG: HD domain-containing protein [Chthoniobacter sp.]|uniref:HD domain-containing protein n=1 Tax=Chthoniobacter sp. TaxID=2510640 RepID=UPI0032A73B3C
MLKQRAVAGRLEAAAHGQVESLVRKETRDGKPFWELVLADAEAKITLRAWSDAPAYALCEELSVGVFLEVTGEFVHNGGFGLDAKRWAARELTAEERDTLLAGSPELREKQAADYGFIEQATIAVSDPRLRELAALFLGEYGARFRRAAAARGNHHARRGGLVEHVAQMMRSALAIAGAYPALNRDLLTAGVLFHDAGKLWENSLPADGFVMPFDERGEMLGHITIGIELVNALWRKVLATEAAATWGTLRPASEDVRLHLLHLLAAHHGELQFGSPVVPKTPEAWALHYVDNLDAKMEMMTAAYATSRSLAPRIQERVWPLPGNLVTPLEKFTPPDSTPPESAS